MTPPLRLQSRPVADGLESWIRDVMSGAARGPVPALLRGTLGAVEPIYAAAAARRNQRFDRGARPIQRLPRPVISVGNLTTGGTGKTPFVQYLARQLQARGMRPGILLRGYGRGAAVESDEERVLRESLPGCIAVADPDRAAGGRRALAQDESIDVFLLDDGFQHRRLHRDRDVVLLDATNPFGYDHVLPRGMLRERPAGLGRADLIVITRAERVDETQADAIERAARVWARPGTPIVGARYRMDEARQDDGPPIPLESLAGRRVFAASAIGNPDAFEAGLAAAGLNVVGRRRFADHHAYTAPELQAVRRAATDAGATLLCTTEKDWAKLREVDSARSPDALPFVRVGIRVDETTPGFQAAIEALLEKIPAR